MFSMFEFKFNLILDLIKAIGCYLKWNIFFVIKQVILTIQSLNKSIDFSTSSSEVIFCNTIIFDLLWF